MVYLAPMVDFRQQSRYYLAWLREQVRKWTFLIVKALQASLGPETALAAAAISYFTLFSLFPLTLLSVAIASLWLDPLLAESEIIRQLEFVAPAVGELLGDNIERIVLSRGPVTTFALLVLLWSSSNIFNVLTRTMDKIWEVVASRSPWRHRGLAILTALTISALLLAASFAEGTLLTIANSLLPEEWQIMRPYTVGFWWALASTALFAILYYFLPHVKLAWRSVLPGAIVAGLLWELAKRAFLYFLATYVTRSNLVYGSVGAITAFLTWTYVSSIIFLFGAYLNREHTRFDEAERQVIHRSRSKAHL